MSMIDDTDDNTKDAIKEAQRRKQEADADAAEDDDQGAAEPAPLSDVARAVQDTLGGKHVSDN